MPKPGQRRTTKRVTFAKVLSVVILEPTAIPDFALPPGPLKATATVQVDGALARGELVRIRSVAGRCIAGPTLLCIALGQGICADPPFCCGSRCVTGCQRYEGPGLGRNGTTACTA